MRPRHLRLRAFGAYPGTEEVDFDDLAALGLFAVTGPTGAGKTTLFDAMAFALYGELPGDRPGTDVRSHHAEPGDLCEVELTFTVEGRTYRVRRTPEQQRPKKRGAGTTTEPATAELHARDPDGTEHPIAAGIRPVTDECVRLVGLDAGQFERVVLLPQGKFQQFLLAGTRERRPLLQQLFGTSLFRDAVEELKRRAAELRRQVERVDADLDHHRLNAKDHLRAVVALLGDDELDGVEPDDEVDLLEAFWQKLAPRVADVERASHGLVAEARTAATLATAARGAAQRWDQRATLRERSAELEAATADVDRFRAISAGARAAAPVVAAASAHDRTAAERREASAAADAALGALRAAVAGAGLVPDGDGLDPDLVAGTADAALGELERVERLHAQLAAARAEAATRAAALGDLRHRQAELADDQQRTEQLRAELDERRQQLEPVAATAAELRARVEASADRLARRRRLEVVRREVDALAGQHRRAEDHLAEVLAAFVAGAAPRLAAALRPGEACPVCGSAEHPAPAPPSGDDGIGVAELERAQELTGRAATDLAGASRTVEELRGALGPDADLDPTDLDTAHQELLGEEQRAVAAATELEAVLARIEKGTRHHEALREQAAELAVALAGSEAALSAAEERVAQLAAEAGDLDPAEVAGRRAGLTAVVDAVGRCRAADAHLRRAQGALDHAATALSQAVEASGLPDLDAARATWVAPSELAQLERRIADHDAAVEQVRGALAALDDAEVPDERPDAEVLEAAALDLRRRAEADRERVARLLERAHQAQVAIDAAHRVELEATGVREAHELAARVAGLCDGQSTTRIGLETWVLAGELERVTEAANVHLARMTGGRYQLRRTSEAGHRAKQAGLDLTVLDSHTGRTRAPATLSGGEQFQASLALALGLADVVSLGGVGSGRRFEALFVDEGFGSLDPEALDQAVDALHQIHASGRMVGVITHVEAMKQQLPIGIEVRRRPDGRGSTLTAA